MAMIELDTGLFGISAKSLHTEADANRRLGVLFSDLCAIDVKQKETMTVPARMTNSERKIYDAQGKV